MKLIGLELANYRNIATGNLLASDKVHIISGQNAQGKTNLLESIYYLARLKSFRNSRLGDLVRFGEEQAVLHASLVANGITRRVHIQISAKSRRVTVDGKAVGSIGGYCSGLQVVFFTPDDVYLGRGSPEERRRFLDRASFNIESFHLDDIRRYDQVLRRRNALLKVDNARQLEREAIEAYDHTLAQTGARIACRRRMLVELLLPRFQEVFSRISNGSVLQVSMEYRSTVPLVDQPHRVAEVAEAFQRELGGRLMRDWERRSTGMGPHLDDLDLTVDGRSLGTYGSQGQQRLFVLALKIAEAEHLRHQSEDPPLFLLDDISSELDAEKNRLLFEYLEGVNGQVFLTTTDSSLIRIQGGRTEFSMEGGRFWKSS